MKSKYPPIVDLSLSPERSTYKASKKSTLDLRKPLSARQENGSNLAHLTGDVLPKQNSAMPFSESSKDGIGSAPVGSLEDE